MPLLQGPAQHRLHQRAQADPGEDQQPHRQLDVYTHLRPAARAPPTATGPVPVASAATARSRSGTEAISAAGPSRGSSNKTGPTVVWPGSAVFWAGPSADAPSGDAPPGEVPPGEV